MAAGLTEMEAVFCPLLQEYEVPPEAVRVVDSPLQMTLSPVMAGVGNGLTVTVTDVAAEHPLASVTVTEYVVVADGLTEMEAVFCPLLQEYEVPPEAVSVVVSPLQMTLSPVMAGVGSGLTVTVTEVAAEHPLASVTVTE